MMKKALITIVALVLPMMASAINRFYNTNVGDFYYKFNYNSKTASVCCASYENDFYQEGERYEDWPSLWYNINSPYSGSVVIPPEVIYNGITYSVTGIDHYAFYNCSGLTSISIPDGVTSIGDNAFEGCKALNSVTIPNSVTSIGSNAFLGTGWYNNQPDGLIYVGKVAYEYKGTMQDDTEITIEDGTVGIASRAFSGCTGLTFVTIPNSLESIGSDAFSGCSGLTSFTIGSSVTSIGIRAFSSCNNLAKLYCKAKEVPKVTNDDYYYNSYDAFFNIDKDNITLYVPKESLDAYNSDSHWSGFKEIVPLADDGQQVETCATPTISFEKGEFVFSCETEGVTFHYEISRDSSGSTTGNSSGTANKVTAYAPISVTVSVYATKTGYYRSETATATFTGKFGDLNGDGNVDVGDHVELTNIIMAQ